MDYDLFTSRIKRTGLAGGIIAIIAGILAAWLGAQVAWTKGFMGIDQNVLDMLAPPGGALNFLYVVPGVSGIVSGLLGIAAGLFAKDSKKTARTFFITAAILSFPDIIVAIGIAPVTLFFCGAADIKKGGDGVIESEFSDEGEY